MAKNSSGIVLAALRVTEQDDDVDKKSLDAQNLAMRIE